MKMTKKAARTSITLLQKSFRRRKDKKREYRRNRYKISLNKINKN